MILVTPASNIGDFSPFKTEPGPQASALDIQQVDTLKLAATAALDEGDHARAVAIAERALALDDRDAELLYLQARALRAARPDRRSAKGVHRRSRRGRLSAAGLDAYPCDRRRRRRKRNTGFVDFARIVDERSPDGIPGSELFLDHVHPTIEGNRLLALAIVQEMTREGIVSPAATWNAAAIAEISEQLESSLDEQAHARRSGTCRQVLLWAGKHDEAAASRRPCRGHATLRRMAKPISRKRPCSGEPVTTRPHCSIIGRPHASHHGTRPCTSAFGVLLSELGRKAEARVELEAAIRLDRTLVEAHYDLGVVLEDLGEDRQAEAAYRAALELDPNHADAHNNLGVILAKRGDLAAASEQFSEALRVHPGHANATANLARARAARNR